MGFRLIIYERDHAMQMARGYCRRGAYFINLYFDSDDVEKVYTDADVAGYPESDEWTDFVLSVGDNAVVAAKAANIRLGPTVWVTMLVPECWEVVPELCPVREVVLVIYTGARTW